MPAGGSIIQSIGVDMGALARANGEKKKEKALREGSERADAISKDYAAQQGAKYDPYAQGGLGLLDEYNAAAGAEASPFAFTDSSNFLNSYYNSPEFAALNKQASQQIMSNQAATGGLRSGNTNSMLAQVAPTLGIQALQRQNTNDLTAYNTNQAANQQRFSRLGSAVNLGYDATNQQAGAIGQLGATLAGSQNYRGQIRGNKYLRYGEIDGQRHEDQGAIWGNFMGGMSGGGKGAV